MPNHIELSGETSFEQKSPFTQSEQIKYYRSRGIRKPSEENIESIPYNSINRYGCVLVVSSVFD